MQNKEQSEINHAKRIKQKKLEMYSLPLLAGEQTYLVVSQYPPVFVCSPPCLDVLSAFQETSSFQCEDYVPLLNYPCSAELTGTV